MSTQSLLTPGIAAPQNQEIVLKICLIGDTDTGKSTIMNRYVNGEIPTHCFSTIGVDFAIKRDIRKQMQNQNNETENVDVKLQIWDTAGKPQFRAITTSYLKATSVMIVYDITKRSTFDSVQSFYESVKQHSFNPNVIIYLVGNKLDLVSKNPQTREVTYDEAVSVAKEYGMPYVEVSAVEDTNINLLFDMHIDDCLKDKFIDPLVQPISDNLTIRQSPPKGLYERFFGYFKEIADKIQFSIIILSLIEALLPSSIVLLGFILSLTLSNIGCSIMRDKDYMISIHACSLMATFVSMMEVGQKITQNTDSSVKCKKLAIAIFIVCMMYLEGIVRYGVDIGLMNDEEWIFSRRQNYAYLIFGGICTFIFFCFVAFNEFKGLTRQRYYTY